MDTPKRRQSRLSTSPKGVSPVLWATANFELKLRHLQSEDEARVDKILKCIPEKLKQETLAAIAQLQKTDKAAREAKKAQEQAGAVFESQILKCQEWLNNSGIG